MAKKRRDKERDSSTPSKLAKIGAATLAVTAGVAAFNHTGLRRKLNSELLPSALKAKKAFFKEVRESKALRTGFDKRTKGEDLKKAFNKSKETFNKEKEVLKNSKIKFDGSRKNNIFGQMKNIEQKKARDVIRGLKANYESEIRKQIVFDLMSKYTEKNESLDAKTFMNTVLEGLESVKDNAIKDEEGNLHFNKNFLEKHLNKLNFSDETKKEFLEDIYKSREEISEKMLNSDLNIESAKQKIFNEMDKTIKDNKTYKSTLFGKIDNLIKKTTGFNPQLEYLLKGDRAMTVGDFRKYIESEDFDPKEFEYTIKNNLGEKITKNVLDSDTFKELDDDIIFDKNIRINKKGEMYSVKEINDILEKGMDNFSTSTLGRIYGLTDFWKLRRMSPTFANFKALSTSTLASWENNNDTNIAFTSKVAIGNASTGKARLYETTLDEAGNLDLSDSIGEGYIQNNMHGKKARLNKEFVGSNKDIFYKSETGLFEKLDIGQTGSYTLFTRIKDIFTGKQEERLGDNKLKDELIDLKKFLRSDKTIEEKMSILVGSGLYDGDTEEEIIVNTANDILNKNKKLSKLLNKYTASNQINDESIASLIQSGNIQNEDSINILKILNDKDYETVEELVSKMSDVIGDKKFLNTDLEDIINKGLTDSDNLANLQSISQSTSKSIFGYTISSTNVMDAEDIVRREALKEVMLKESANGSVMKMSVLENIIQNSSLSAEQEQSLRYLSNWAIMQKRLSLYNSLDNNMDLNQLLGDASPLKDLQNLMENSSTFKENFLNMIDDLGTRSSIYDKVAFSDLNETVINEYDNYTFMKESTISSLHQVRSLNDAITAGKNIASELFASRDGDMSNYTTLTQIPQFMLSRLMWGLEGVGLNLSTESTKSNLDLIKNIALKRVLPVMAAYHIYDYLDHESENITGTSITGATANAVAGTDLAFRKIAYKTGLGQAIDWFKESSVITDYWTDDTDFQTADERREWYKDGVSVVRQGRFWGFGSSNEFRGGSVQYYQPNYLRRAHSNYKEVSLYGDPSEKWAHSWIPTPTHPLSPIRAFLDPYWLEKKHMEDRPYPLTGKMFAEGTPWGAILNPTVGQVLKPVRMLPEVRNRLAGGGGDVKSAIRRINDKIKERAKRKNKEENDVLIFEGTDVRNAAYIPYGNPLDGEMHIQIKDGKATAKGTNFLRKNVTQKFSHRVVPNGKLDEMHVQDSSLISPNNEFMQMIAEDNYQAGKWSKQIVANVNYAIKRLASWSTGRNYINNVAYQQGVLPDKSEGTYVYRNLVNRYNVYTNNFYENRADAKDVDKNITNSFISDAIYSGKQLSGIYAFLNDFALGSDDYTVRYANASEMTSFSRSFWDSSIGSTGGELMEIARRFFPSEDKSIIRYNPLRNNMPEWMPERFLTGDPFTALPKGEMRLPGKGYETLNELHPDEFGEYGAFDRFKILADIAPTSEEFKIWRNIAKNTVTDPELKKQIEEIQARANKMSGNHEFYSYRYFNNDVKMHKGVVKAINGNIVTLANGEQLNLGGIKLEKDADISDVLNVGEHIYYKANKNAAKRLEDGLVTNAVIYKKGENINKLLVSEGLATKDKEDRTSIGYLANASSIQETLGMAQEIIGHANIPFLHNKYMKIETARESFTNEQIYGSVLKTWDHPIESFVKPAFNQMSSKSMASAALSVASSVLFMNMNRLSAEPYLKYASGALMYATNPTALLGSGLAMLYNLGVRTEKHTKMKNIEIGAGVGSALGAAVWGWNNAENPLKATVSFAAAGHAISKYLDIGDGFKGAKIGAAIGLGISALKNSRMSKDMIRKKWIPKKAEKKFEMDEYFDRIEYIKYKGLYNQAALRAFLFERGTNVWSAFRRIDKNKKKVAKLVNKAEKLSNKYIAGGYEYEAEMKKINDKIQALESDRTMLRGGKYTRAAVAYKKAMESTIYGLSAGATKDEILAAIPDQYKDYFMNFINETDRKERKKILKTLPEYLRKPLQIAWGEKINKVDSNRKFFSKHKMPNVMWRGWKPNVNLKHVKMKTIQNEGMLLSDFGYYESEKGKAQYEDAPDIENFDKGSGGIGYLSNITSVMSGLGMSVQNVSLSTTSAPGLWIVGDISQTTKDVKKISDYGVRSGIQGLVSALF